jgi:hypothetical protein
MKFDVFHLTSENRHLCLSGVVASDSLSAIKHVQGGEYKPWNGLVLIEKRKEHKIYIRKDNGLRYVAIPTK